jgi:hypothetical protein
VFAYGQTGSGKSFTMGSIAETLSPDGEGGTSIAESSSDVDKRGIIPRVACDIFRRLEELRGKEKGARYAVKISFVEIYNEEVSRRSCQGDEVDALNISGGRGRVSRPYLSRPRRPPV